MNKIEFTSAQYCKNENDDVVGIKAVVNGKAIGVPIYVGNRHYDELMRQVAAGELTIAEAD